MTTHLIDSLATTEALADVFSDASVLDAMLRVEAALARVQARAGLIPAQAAEAIMAAAHPDGFEAIAIARETQQSGTPVIGLVHALAARVAAADPASATYVHWGATSQDITDTAFVLTLKRARQVMAADQQRLERALHGLSERHVDAVMLGRTLLQPAAPTTFGLKAAGWFAAARRSWRRVEAACDAGLMLQFGGAAGTLAAFGDRGPALAQDLAAALELPAPDAPWHAHRDRLAAIVAALGIYVGTLGKIARDVSLLMQHEVGEVSEIGGGSSAMPHKQNPVGSAVVLAGATRAPGLVASFLSGMVQEHERSVGGLHAEWPTVASLVQTAGAALSAMAHAAERLMVDPDRMRANLDATHGAVLSEQIVMRLAPALGREAAARMVATAADESRRTGESLVAIIKAMPHISADLLEGVEPPENYLGAAEEFRRRLLQEH